MTKLSIIIPIYKVEKYIIECLESVCSQLVDGVEVILVNDGTPDYSMKMAKDYIGDKYRQYLNQFIFIDQYNQGISGARNTGIKNAKGKYISFLDSDDKLLENYFIKIMNAIDEFDFDLLDFNFKYSNGVSSRIRSHKKSQNIDSVFVRNSWFLWARVFSKDLIKNEQFEDGIYYEDLDFLPHIYIKAKKIIHLDDFLYSYRVNMESITQNINKDNSEKTIYSLEIILNKYYSYYESDRYNMYYRLMVLHCYYLLCIYSLRRCGYIESLNYFSKYDFCNLRRSENYLLGNMEGLKKIFLKFPKIFLCFYLIYIKIFK